MTSDNDTKATDPVANPLANRRQPVRAPRLIIADEPETGWQRYAACAGADADAFFPISDSETGVALLQIQDAKKICARCSVRERCLEWALDVGENFGVWGGASPKERQSMKRQAYRAEARQAKQAAA